jgi:hypothetical protein
MGAARARTGLQGDQIAVEIIKRCTGEATFGEIIDDLAKTFPSAPRQKNPCGYQRAVARLGRQEAAGIVIRSQRPHLWRAATRHS